MTILSTCKQVLRQRRFPAGAVLFLALATAAIGFHARPASPSDSGVTLMEAQRSKLVVAVSEKGTFEPVTETTIRNEVDGTSRIIFLVKEGSHVEEGDLLVEFDASEQEGALERRRLALEARKAAHAAAEGKLIITRSDAESALRKAQLAVDFARMDLEKFEKLEKSQILRESELDVLLAEESLRISKERFQISESLTAEGFETESTLNRDKLAVVTDSARLERAQSQETMESQYDLIKRSEKLHSELIETRKEQMRTERETQSRIVKAEARLGSAESSLELAQLALEDAEQQLAATKVRAPHAGMVLYGASSSHVTRESMIEEGATVRNRQEILTIPDTSTMKLRIKVHETVASDVQTGQEAVITVDSTPDRVLRGKVSRVALFPERQSGWGGSSARVYEAEVTITDSVEGIQPGASGQAQIVLHYLEDVITVPVAAVNTIEGQQIVEVSGSRGNIETRPVTIGVFNESRMHVLSGLEEGETVVVREAG